jgi:hypothetical protein
VGTNSLQVDVNGQRKTYVGSDFDFSMGKWMTLLSADQYNPHQDYFLLELPSGVKQGDVIVDRQSRTPYSTDPVEQAFNLTNNMKLEFYVTYSDRGGVSHSAGASEPDTYFKITIDQWGGRGHQRGRSDQIHQRPLRREGPGRPVLMRH